MSASRGSSAEDAGYELTLFINGASDLSARAVTMAKHICDRLVVHYHLAVVDIHEDPVAALGYEVLVAPTLVKHWPRPVRKLVGDLSDTDKVLTALGLPVGEAVETPGTGQAPRRDR
jgi:circadian clock protein KaiB